MFDSLPRQVMQILSMLQRAGFQAFLVGGCVRDTIMGAKPHDYDITTDALPAQTRTVFSAFPVLETGLKHGTVTLLLDGKPYEITTFRTDGTYSDNRHPDGVTFTRSLREDTARRDFTINAMAWNPAEGLVDDYGGEADIKNQLLRCVGDPTVRFREDALRILRALRFASVLGFAIEADTASAIHDCKELLTNISAERIYAELCRLLCGKNAETVLLQYRDALAVVLPEIAPMFDFEQHNFHHVYDVFTHCVRTCAALPCPDPALKWAALLHDCGKPETFSMDENGVGHFYGHAQRGADLAHSIMRRLKADNETVRRVTEAVRHHDTPTEPDARVLTKRLSRWGEVQLRDVLLLQRADNLAMAADFRFRQKTLEEAEALLTQILEKAPCLTVRDLALKGGDLMKLGFREKAIGDAQRTLLKAVLNGETENEINALKKYLNIT